MRPSAPGRRQHPGALAVPRGAGHRPWPAPASGAEQARQAVETGKARLSLAGAGAVEIVGAVPKAASLGVFTTVASTRPVLARMCGDSHSANSAASLITSRQSALGLPDVVGGDGQLRKGDSPVAIARTSTFTSNTTGTATGPGRLTAAVSRPCKLAGSPLAATHRRARPPPPARRCAPGVHAAAPSAGSMPAAAVKRLGPAHRPQN